MALPSTASTAGPTSVPPVVSSTTAPGPPAGFGGGSAVPATTEASPAPIKALDELSEKAKTPGGGLDIDGVLDRAESTILGFVGKVQTTTKPYTDAAAAQVQKVVDRIEGNTSATPGTAAGIAAPPSTTTTTTPATTTAAAPGEKSVLDDVAATTEAAAANVAARAQGVFAAVSNTFSQLTHTIDEKTATPSHPGILTQVTQAFEKGASKVDELLNEQGQKLGSAPAVQTTTNSVPHTEAKSDPAPSVGSTTLPAGTMFPTPV